MITTLPGFGSGEHLHCSLHNCPHYEELMVPSRHHWAPVWLTCGLCHDYNIPDYVLKVETLEEDITDIFENEFGMVGDQYVFPRVKTMGSKTVPGSSERSGKFLAKYFGQLTKEQVLSLYEMYKMDFLLFNYNVTEFMHLAMAPQKK